MAQAAARFKESKILSQRRELDKKKLVQQVVQAETRPAGAHQAPASRKALCFQQALVPQQRAVLRLHDRCAWVFSSKACLCACRPRAIRCSCRAAWCFSRS